MPAKVKPPKLSVTKRSVSILTKKLIEGGIYLTRRQCGKSTAILAACHKLGASRCLVVVINKMAEETLQRLWVKHFSVTEQCPTIVSGNEDRVRMAGLGKDFLFIDEYWRCSYFGPCHAAVATPPFKVEVLEI